MTTVYEFPHWIERDFDRRAFLPRLAVLFVLLLGAIGDYGYDHRVGHWIVLLVCVAGTILTAAAAHSRSAAAHPWRSAVATFVDAVLAIYVIADHIPRNAQDLRFATDAVSLMPTFLFLFQTGFRLRRSLVSLFAITVCVGWVASLGLLLDPSFLQAQDGSVAIIGEALNLAAFLTASLFVLNGVTQMTNAITAALQAREDRFRLARFLPKGIALDFVRGGETSTIAERHACLLSVDLRGSSQLAREHPSADVLTWLLEFRALVNDAVASERGIIDKYLGDGVLALFLDGSDQEQAAGALGAVRAIFKRLEQWNLHRERAGEPRLAIIASLHSGRVLAGVFDDGRRAEFTVLGPAMNDLPRIERCAKKANADIAASAYFIRLLTARSLKEVASAELALSETDRELPRLVALSFMSIGVES